MRRREGEIGAWFGLTTGQSSGIPRFRRGAVISTVVYALISAGKSLTVNLDESNDPPLIRLNYADFQLRIQSAATNMLRPSSNIENEYLVSSPGLKCPCDIHAELSIY